MVETKKRLMHYLVCMEIDKTCTLECSIIKPVEVVPFIQYNLILLETLGMELDPSTTSKLRYFLYASRWHPSLWEGGDYVLEQVAFVPPWIYQGFGILGSWPKFNFYLAIALVKCIFCRESIFLQANNVNNYFCRSWLYGRLCS